MFCSAYKNRPKECAEHDYPFEVCPIGMGHFGLNGRSEVLAHILKAREVMRSEQE